MREKITIEIRNEIGRKEIICYFEKHILSLENINDYFLIKVDGTPIIEITNHDYEIYGLDNYINFNIIKEIMETNDIFNTIIYLRYIYNAIEKYEYNEFSKIMSDVCKKYKEKISK